MSAKFPVQLTAQLRAESRAMDAAKRAQFTQGLPVKQWQPLRGYTANIERLVAIKQCGR